MAYDYFQLNEKFELFTHTSILVQQISVLQFAFCLKFYYFAISKICGHIDTLLYIKNSLLPFK